MEGVSRTTGIVDRTEARINQAAMDAVGIGALEDAALASLIYTQVFFAGGYGAGYGDFAEGEGVCLGTSPSLTRRTARQYVSSAPF
jgi:hypothetical protein